MTGKLVLVPTPIGNLGDITLRALETLKSVDLILAEDTRQTSKLLKHYEITVHTRPFHQHNEHKALAKVLDELRGGAHFALVSDAGTPGISDPGFLLVRACRENDIAVETLPGATAFVPALVNSGLPCDRFVFEGFLPQKKGRQSRIEALKTEERTLVFYESPYRLVKALQQMAEVFGEERPAAVARELSKIHEETRCGTLAELKNHYEAHPPKGEIVLVVGGAK